MPSDHVALPGPATLHDSAPRHLDVVLWLAIIMPWILAGAFFLLLEPSYHFLPFPLGIQLAFLLTPPALVLTIRACVRGNARLPIRPTLLLLGLSTVQEIGATIAMLLGIWDVNHCCDDHPSLEFIGAHGDVVIHGLAVLALLAAVSGTLLSLTAAHEHLTSSSTHRAWVLFAHVRFLFGIGYVLPASSLDLAYLIAAALPAGLALGLALHRWSPQPTEQTA